MGMSYFVAASPGWTVMNATGITLTSGGATMANTTITTSFGNPFESLMWKAVLQFATSTPRMTAYMHMGMPVSLGAGMYQ